MTTTRFTTYLVCGGTALLLSVAIGHAQGNAHDHPAAPPQESRTEHTQATASQHAMMMDMQGAQKKLDDLVSQMNAATGAEKVDRIAAVVTEMAAMHKQMSGMMMQGGMMQMMRKPHDAIANRP
jgi:hypothetical protein